jgi:hypothetical protein
MNKGGTMTDSPYGHDYPVLDALADWVQATDPFTLPAEEITGEMRLNLVEATRKLNSAIIDLVPYSQEAPEELRSLAYNIRAHVRDLSMQFIVDEYTDSNTDEPCDVEWDVTGLVMMKDPTYVRPDEITPAYVANTLPGPPEDLN